MIARRSAGFTLLETVIALTLLAAMLAMLFGGLRLGVRSWDAGLGRAERADNLLLTTSFLRRELGSAFPWRLKDPLDVRLAFVGERERVQFVSLRPADFAGGGLAFVSFAYEPAGAGDEAGRLVMRRAFAAADAKDLSALDEVEKFTLIEGITSARFEYFGAENDIVPPAWAEKWEVRRRLPSHVRIEIEAGKRKLPAIVVALRLGEEAGCYESPFQRLCVPRR